MLVERYRVLSKLFLEEIEIWEIWDMLHGVLHADGSSVLEATPCAFTGAEVHGCHGTKIMFISCYARLPYRTSALGFNVEYVLRGVVSKRVGTT